MTDKVKLKNEHDTAEGWGRELANGLRPYFAKHGYALPRELKVTIGFTSQGRKGKAFGESLLSDAAADGTNHIIVRSDRDDPHGVADVVCHQLVHVVVGPKHDQKFRVACDRLGLDTSSGLRTAMPGQVFRDDVLTAIVNGLGPLPHARIDFSKIVSADRPKKQGTRMLKMYCGMADCDLSVRTSDKNIKKFGVLPCPFHGPMIVESLDPEAQSDGQTIGSAAEEITPEADQGFKEAAE